jgi:hypothetical protein
MWLLFMGVKLNKKDIANLFLLSIVNSALRLFCSFVHAEIAKSYAKITKTFACMKNDISYKIIGAAIELHKTLCPGWCITPKLKHI